MQTASNKREILKRRRIVHALLEKLVASICESTSWPLFADVRKDMDHNEYGCAVDLLYAVIYKKGIRLTAEQRSSLFDLIATLGMEDQIRELEAYLGGTLR